jgi:hypothetical protein
MDFLSLIVDGRRLKFLRDLQALAPILYLFTTCARTTGSCYDVGVSTFALCGTSFSLRATPSVLHGEPAPVLLRRNICPAKFTLFKTGFRQSS